MEQQLSFEFDWIKRNRKKHNSLKQVYKKVVAWFLYLLGGLIFLSIIFLIINPSMISVLVK